MHFNRSQLTKTFSSFVQKLSEEKLDRKTVRKEVPLLLRDLGVFVLIASLIMLPVPMTAAAAENKWGPHADITGKLGDERSLGDYDFFVPVLQGPASMLFLDLRFQNDDHEGKEGNFGLGYRQMINDAWIFGGYGFYDVRETQFDNKFRQWTFGLEALTERYDARVNAYFADEHEEAVSSVTGVEGFAYEGFNLVHLATPGFEQSMSGFDFEVGGKMPGLAYPEIRGYVGGFYFDADEVDKISGPRARLEVRFPDMFGWDGSLFEVGGEIRDDSVRDTDYYFTARLRIPFGTGTFAQPTSSLNELEKRMTERVQRDPDVVVGTESNSGTNAVVKTIVTNEGDDIIVHHYNSDSTYNTGTFEQPARMLDGVDPGAPTPDIALLHADSVFTGAGLVMQPNQRVLGEYDGMMYIVPTDKFGDIELPRATDGTMMPRITNAPTAITASDNSEISGVDIVDAGTGIDMTDLLGPVDIGNVTIDGGGNAIVINNSAGLITFTDVDMTPGQKGFDIGNSSADIFMYNSSVFTDNNLAVDISNDTGSFFMDSDSMITATSDFNAEGMSFSNADGTYLFNGAVLLTGTDTGISIGGSTGGDFDFNDLTVVDPDDGSSALYLSGNDAGTTIDVAGPSSVTVNSDAYVLSVFGGDQSTLTLDGTVPLTAYNGAGMRFNNADGTYNVFGEVVLDGSASGGDTGIDVFNGSDGDITFYNSVAINNPVGDGIFMNDSAGSLTSTDTAPLTVVTGAGNGIYAYNSGTLTVAGAANSVDATGGAALDIEQTSTDMTFASLTSLDSTGDGVHLYNVTGIGAGGNALTVTGATDVDNAANHGIQIDALLAGNVTFGGSVDVYNTIGGHGINLTNNVGTVAFADTVDVGLSQAGNGIFVNSNSGSTIFGGATNIYNSSGSGLFVNNNLAAVSFNDTLDISDSDIYGAIIAANQAPVTVSGATTIDDSTSNGLFIVVNPAAVSFNSTLDVTDSGGNGIEITGNTGAVTVDGATTVYNSGGFGVISVLNGPAPVAFNDTLEVGESGSFGVYVAANTGTFTVDGSTTIYNSGVDGLYVQGNLNDVSLNDTLDITNSGGAGAQFVGNLNSVTVTGATTIYNSANNGLVASGNIGSVSLNDTLDVGESGGLGGVLLVGNSGGVSIDGATTVYNSATGYGVLVNGNNTNPVAFNSTLDVTNSGIDGVNILGNTSGVSVAGATTVYNSLANGLLVSGNSAPVAFNDTLDVSISGTSGATITGNLNSVTVTGATTIYNSGTDGLNVTGNTGAVAFGSTLDIGDSDDDGAEIASNMGPVSVAGIVTIDDSLDRGLIVRQNMNSVTFSDAVDIDNSGTDGLYIANNTRTVDFENGLTIDNSGNDGMRVIQNASASPFVDSVTVTGDTAIYNSGNMGLGIRGANDPSAVTFNGNLTIGNADGASGGDGMQVANYNGAVVVTGATSIYNTANVGLEFRDSAGDVTMNSVVITDTGAQGINIFNNTGTYNAIKVDVSDTGLAGVQVDTNQGPVIIDDLDIQDTGNQGLFITNTTGPVTVLTTTVYNSAAGFAAVEIGETLGAVDLGVVDIQTDKVDATGLDIYNSADLTIAAGQIITTNATAVEMYNVATIDVNLATVTSNNAPASSETGAGVSLDMVMAGTYNVATTTVSGSDANGVEIFDSGVTVEMTDVDVDNTGADGIQLANNWGTYNSTTVNVNTTGGNGIAIYNSAVTGTVDMHDVDILNTTYNGMILANNSGTYNALTVDITTTGGAGLVQYNSAATGDVSIGDLTVKETQKQGVYILENLGDFVVDNVTTVYNSAAGYAAVEIAENSGDVDLSDVDIHTVAVDATGLDIYNSADLTITNGTVGQIVTANATAVQMYNVATVDVTLDLVESNNAPAASDTGAGVSLDQVIAGTYTVTQTTVNNADQNGVEILDSGVAVEMTDVDVDTTGNDGIQMANNWGTYNSSTVDVRNTSGNGIAIYNSAVTGTVDMHDVDILNTTYNGMILANNSGTYNALTVDITTTGGAGLVHYNSAATGDVSIGDLTVKETQKQGVYILENLGDFVVDNVTTVYNSAAGFAAVEIAENSGDVDLSDVDIHTVAVDATGLDIYNSADLTITNGTVGQIVTANATAVEMYNVATVDVTLDTVTSNNAPAGSDTGAGVSLDMVAAGTYTVTDTTVNNAFANGVEILDSGVAVEMTDVDVDTTGNDGIQMANNWGTYNSSTVDVRNTSGNGISIYNSAATGDVDMHFVDVSNTTYNGMVLANNSGSYNAVTVDITNTTAAGMINYNSAVGADVSIGDLTVKETGKQGVYMNWNEGNFVVDNVTTVYNSAAGFAAVEIAENFGDVDLSDVDIDTVAVDATGLEIYNSADLTISSGSIVTANATAVEMYNVATVDVTLDTVTSNNAPAGSDTGAGVSLDMVAAGTYTVTDTTIDNSAGNGVEIFDSGVTVEMTNVEVDSATDTGVLLANNTGTYNSTSVDVDTATVGVMVYNSAASGDVTMDNVVIEDTTSYGMLLQDNAGSFDALDVDVMNAGADGIAIYNSAVGGDVTMADVTVIDTTYNGISLAFNEGDVTIGTAAVYNTGSVGIDVYEAEGLTTFGATGVYNAATHGIQIDTVYNAVVFGATTVDESGESGAEASIGIYNNTLNGTVTFDDVTVTNRHGVGIQVGDLADPALDIDAAVAFDDVLIEAPVAGNTNTGIEIFDTSVNGSATFNSVTINESGGAGMDIFRNQGDVTVTGPTVIYNAAWDGMYIEDNTNNVVEFNGLQVTALDGAGIFAANNTGEIYVFNPNNDNFVDATGGIALFNGALNIYNSAIDMEFETLTSTNSWEYGIFMQEVDGIGTLNSALLVNQATTISGAGVDGIFIDDLTAGTTVTFNGATVSGSSANGMTIGSTSNIATGNEAGSLVTFNGDVSVLSSNTNGIEVSENAGGVLFNSDLTVDGTTTEHGIYIHDNAGDFEVKQDTLVQNTDDHGVFVVDNTAGAITYNGLTVADTGQGAVVGKGVFVQNSASTFTAGTTNVSDTYEIGIDLDGANGAVTFGDTTVTNAGDPTGDSSIRVNGNTGTVEFGDTTVNDRNGIGIEIAAADATVDFNHTTINDPVLGNTTDAISIANTTVNGDITYNSVTITSSLGHGINVDTAAGDVDFGNTTINNINNAADANREHAVTITNSSGTYTFDSLDATSDDGAGLRVIGDGASNPTVIVYNATGTSQLTATNYAALELNEIASVDMTFDDLTSTDSTVDGVQINNVDAGSITVTGTTTVTNATDHGVEIDTTLASVDLGTISIDGAGIDGVHLIDSSGLTISGGTIDQTTNDGIYAENSNLTVANTDIGVGGGTGIGGDGIEVVVDSGSYNVAITGTTLSNITETGIAMDGTAGGTLFVTDLSDITVTDAGAGGIIVNTAIFDADPNTGAIDAVAGGDLLIGNSGDTTDITGDGLHLAQVLGEVAFDDLTIYNDSGTGVYIRDAGGKGGTFTFSNASGSVTTTNGTALDIDPVILDMTLSSVSSTDAAGSGIILDTVAGDVTIDTINIDNSGSDAMVIRNSSANVAILGNVLIEDSGGEGIALIDNTGSFVAQDTVTIDNTTYNSILVRGTTPGAYTGTVTFEEDVIITGRDAAGVMIDSIDGDVSFGTNNAELSISGNGGPGDAPALVIYNTAATSDVYIDQLTALGQAGSGSGAVLTDNEGNIRIGDSSEITSFTGGSAFIIDGGSGTVVYNGTVTNDTNGYVVEVINRTGGDVTFNDELIASGANGILIEDNAASSTITFDGNLTLYTGNNQRGIEIYNSLGTNSFTGGMEVVTNRTLVAGNAEALYVESGGELIITGTNTLESNGDEAIYISGNGPGTTTDGITLDVTFDTVNSIGSKDRGISVDTIYNSTFTITDTGTSSSIESSEESAIDVSDISGSDTTVFNISDMDIRDPGTLGGTNYNALRIENGGTSEFYMDDVNVFDTTRSSASVYYNSPHTGIVDWDNSVFLGDTSSGLVVTEGNASTTIFDPITYDSGAGYAITVNPNFTGDLTFEGQIDVTSGLGFDFGSSSGSFTFDTGAEVNMDGMGLTIVDSDGTYTFNDNVNITNTPGDAVTVSGVKAGYNGATVYFSNLNVSDTGDDGVDISNTGNGLVTIDSGTIYNTAGSGVNLVDASLLIDQVDIGNPGSPIGGDGISALYNSAGSYDLTITNNTIDNVPSGRGIDILAYNGAVLDVDLTNNNVTSDQEALRVYDSDGVDPDTGTINLNQSGNTYNSTSVDPAVDITGSGLTINVNSMTNETVVGGGANYNTVTFAVAGGSLTTDGTVTIANSDGSLQMDSLTVNDSSAEGVVVYNSTGTMNFTALSVYNSATDGVVFDGTTADVTIGALTIDETGGEGLYLDGYNAATFTVSSATIYNSLQGGVQIWNTGSTGDVSINNTSVVYNSGGLATGVWMLNNDGNISIYNSVVDGYTSHGVHARNSSVTLDQVDILDTDRDGLKIDTASTVNANDVLIDTAGFEGVLVLDSTATITNSAILNSTQEGIDASNSVVSLTNSIVNSATLDGIRATTDSTVTVANSAILNTGSSGVFARDSHLTLEDSTIDTTGGNGVYVRVEDGNEYNAAILDSSVTNAANNAVGVISTNVAGGTINLYVYNSAALTSTATNVEINPNTGTVNLACDPTEATCAGLAPNATSGPADDSIATSVLQEQNTDAGAFSVDILTTPVIINNAATLGF